MIRALGPLVLVFAVPFALYVGWLAVRLANPFAVERWTRRVVIPLALVGLVCALGGLVVLGLTVHRHEGGYVPAHLENGRIVPGRMQ